MKLGSIARNVVLYAVFECAQHLGRSVAQLWYESRKRAAKKRNSQKKVDKAIRALAERLTLHAQAIHQLQVQAAQEAASAPDDGEDE